MDIVRLLFQPESVQAITAILGALHSLFLRHPANNQ